MRANAVCRLLALLVACAASLAAAASSAGFDYLMLSRQWGPTFCELNTCSGSTKTVPAFTLHGLWPSSNSGSSPQYCNSGNKFSTKNLQSGTLNQMNCEWPSISGPNEGFWSSEWSKHGTCSLNVFPTQQDYFSQALALADEYDLDAALAKGGVSLSQAQVSPSAVTSAVQKAWGVPPTLVCVQGMLFEVRTCFTPSLKIIKCPTDNQCSSTKSQSLPDASSSVTSACAPYFAPGGAGGSTASTGGSAPTGSGSSGTAGSSGAMGATGGTGSTSAAAPRTAGSAALLAAALVAAAAFALL